MQQQKYKIRLHSESERTEKPVFARTNDVLRLLSTDGQLSNRKLEKPGDARPMFPGELREVLVGRAFKGIRVSQEEFSLLDNSRPLASCVAVGYGPCKDPEGFFDYNREGQRRRMEIPKGTSVKKGELLYVVSFGVDETGILTVKPAENSVWGQFTLPMVRGYPTFFKVEGEFLRIVGPSSRDDLDAVYFTIPGDEPHSKASDYVGVLGVGAKPGCYGEYRRVVFFPSEQIGDQYERSFAIPIVELVG